MAEERVQWYYRGSLKSCNYSCSYCPFAKRAASEKERKKDCLELERFADCLQKNISARSAVQIVPYGEALRYSYYWKILAYLSANPKIEYVGAQTNLSFSVEDMLSLYLETGGDTSKLCIWATFHPEMTTMETFVGQCSRLHGYGVHICAGCVGIPENVSLIRKLRHALPDTIYFWINKMDGLGRAYTEEERNMFCEIDPFFRQELRHHPAQPEKCKNSRFVTADGTVYRCNLSKRAIGNIYEDFSSISGNLAECGRRECSCYLAYCNCHESGMEAFEPYPAFRMFL